MIVTVKGPSDPRFCAALETMFADRKRLFVDLLKWDLLVEQECWEKDAFDTEEAVYLIALDQLGEHAGSLRLLPSTAPHILGSLFSGLCEDGVPTGLNTFEITRLCLPVRHGAAERLRIRNALITAMVDYALEHGIEQLTGVVEVGFREQILTMGWRCEALGKAKRFGGAALGAFIAHIDRETPALMATQGVYQAELGHAGCGLRLAGALELEEVVDA